ncbi:MAG: hypothetical protein QOI24_3223 [Acidobacteriota bacterium]|jgi:hypothetical protein|nr:hypothetical protein [Acidobacteriota bacterium]
MPKKSDDTAGGPVPPVNVPDNPASPPAPTIDLAEPKPAPFVDNGTEREIVDINSWPQAPLRIGSVDVNLQESSIGHTTAQGLWAAIHKGTQALSFSVYEKYVNSILCPDAAGHAKLPPHLLNGVDSYKVLKAATEVFLMDRCATVFDLTGYEVEDGRLGLGVERDLVDDLKNYLKDTEGMLPYLHRITEAFNDIGPSPFCSTAPIADKVLHPCAIELYWSLWHEHGMMVQAINAISLRFQNKRGPGDREPLANLEMHPLRPLSHIFWGYVQDEDHRLTVARRAYEYRHEYGLSLIGKAVPTMRVADDRSKFLAAFHALLHHAAIFYERASNLTIRADGFPLLNALREVHLILAEGAHNQFRGLTWTARAEMMMQQWILSRREMREFLGARPMVPYAEPWMSVVDSMKRLMGWTDTSVTHFRDLAVHGEQILLSIRYGDWSVADNENEARGWAQFWKTEIQRYIHAYHAVTGVDLGVTPVATSSREVDATEPAILMQQQLARQRR